MRLRFDGYSLLPGEHKSEGHLVFMRQLERYCEPGNLKIKKILSWILLKNVEGKKKYTNTIQKVIKC